VVRPLSWPFFFAAWITVNSPCRIDIPGCPARRRRLPTPLPVRLCWLY